MKMSSKRLLGTVVILCAAWAFADCKGAPTQAPYGSDLPVPQGEFVGKTAAVDPASTPLHGECAAGPGTIDPRLQAGMVFESVYKTINGMAANKTLAIRSRIVSVSPTDLEERVMPTSSSGINTAQTGVESPLVCSYDSANTASCKAPSFIAEMSPTTSGDFDKCQLTGDNATTGSTSAVYGAYKLAGGATVNAYQIMTTYEGTLMCGGRSKGQGKRVDVLVVSNDVPAEGVATSCGGTRLFDSSVYQTKIGAVLYGYSIERTVIPTSGAPAGSPKPLPSPTASPSLAN